jgi:cytochrome c oxidase subunit 4
MADSHAAHDTHGHPDHPEHDVKYIYVFAALCIFTLLSILADGAGKIGMPHALVMVAVLAIATAKALSVMLYFMHLKFERNWKYVLLAPVTILAIGVPLALLPDVGFHYYVEDIPQIDNYGQYQDRVAEHAAEGHGAKPHLEEPDLGTGETKPAEDAANPPSSKLGTPAEKKE